MKLIGEKKCLANSPVLLPLPSHNPVLVVESTSPSTNLSEKVKRKDVPKLNSLLHLTSSTSKGFPTSSLIEKRPGSARSQLSARSYRMPSGRPPVSCEYQSYSEKG